MLAKAPEIFPIYHQLSEKAKEVIKNEFFYLHLRHLQLGEVPVESVSKDALEQPRNLMVAFWYANATGFSIGNPGYPIGENTGPTISDDQRDQFEKLLVALRNNNLTDYYAKDSIFKERPNLRASFSREEVEFICRLGKMLSFVNLKEDDTDYLAFVVKNEALIKDLVSLETKTFSEHKIEAFTFLPAVLKALKERVMPEKQTAEILGMFLSLQRQLYLSTPMIIECLGANRTIPLYGLSTSQDQMLKMFADSDNKQDFHFEASMDNFINVKLVDGPVPNLTERNKATASNK